MSQGWRPTLICKRADNVELCPRVPSSDPLTALVYVKWLMGKPLELRRSAGFLLIQATTAAGSSNESRPPGSEGGTCANQWENRRSLCLVGERQARLMEGQELQQQTAGNGAPINSGL